MWKLAGAISAILLLAPMATWGQSLYNESASTSYNAVTATVYIDAGWSSQGDLGCPQNPETDPFQLGTVTYQVGGGPVTSVPSQDISQISVAMDCNPDQSPDNVYKVQINFSDMAPGNRNVTFAATFFADNNDLAGPITDQATYSVPGATAQPAYYVVSILYDPPGNESANGFTDSTSNGSTSSIDHSFSESVSTTFGGSLGIEREWTFGQSNGTGETNSFQENHSSGFGSQISSATQPIDHTKDRIYLLLNPQVTIVQTGADSDSFSLSTVDGAPEDILSLTVADMENPSTSTDVRAECNPYILEGNTVPGVCNICANPSACTASDFAPIVAQDLLASSNANPIPSNNGVNRYVLVGSNTITPGTSNSFTQSDSSQQAQTFSQTHAYSVGYTKKGGFTIFGNFSLSWANTATFTWSDSQSVGTSSGTENQAQITLGSSNSSCFSGVDIYEDTVYHTFIPVWSGGSPPSGCN